MHTGSCGGGGRAAARAHPLYRGPRRADEWRRSPRSAWRAGDTHDTFGSSSWFSGLSEDPRTGVTVDASSWEVTQRLLHPKPQHPQPGRKSTTAGHGGRWGPQGKLCSATTPLPRLWGDGVGTAVRLSCLPARGCRGRLPPTSSLCPRHLLGRWHFWDSKINATSSKTCPARRP